MSQDGYNRGYQAGYTGWSTGTPQSALEVVGYWNGQADRDRQAQQLPTYSGGGGSGGEGSIWGVAAGLGILAALVAGIFGGVVGGFYAAAVASVLAGVAAAAATAAVLFATLGILTAIAWIFGPLPKFRLAMLGGIGGAAVQWAGATGLSAHPIGDLLGWAMLGAVALVLAGAACRVALAPVLLLVRR